MAKQVLRAVRMYYAGLALASNVNQVEVAAQAPEVSTDNFAGDGWAEMLSGVLTNTMTFSGFWGAPEPDATLFSRIGSTDAAASVIPFPSGTSTKDEAGATVTSFKIPAAGDIAFFSKVSQLSHQVGGAIGRAAKLQLNLKGTDALVRGKVLEYQQEVAATGNGTPLLVGATSATQKLYLAVHVFRTQGTGETLDLVLQSDDLVGFGSATTRITVPQFSDVGFYFGSIAGPVTDTYYRLARTIAGTSPKFDYVACIGIF